MQTLKTAAIVVLLMTVMYGAYVSLTTPPEPLPADVQSMLDFDDGGSLAIDTGLPDSLGTLEINQQQSSDSVESPSNQDFAPSFGVANVATSGAIAEEGSASDLAAASPGNGITTSFSDLGVSSMEVPSVAAAEPDAVDSTPNYPSTGSTFDLPDPNSLAAAFTPSRSSEGTGDLALASGTADADASGVPPASAEVQTADLPGAGMTPSLGLVNALATADKQYVEDKRREALATLSIFYNTPNLSGEQRSELLARLDPLAREVIYSKRHLLEQPHRVGQNETLMEIAEKYEVPWQLLANINQIADPVTILPGTELKVVRGPFRAEVNLTLQELTLFLGDLYAGRFPIAVGDDPAPKAGTYTVQDKQTAKTYYDRAGSPVPPGSPENPYGNVWLDLGSQLCIHGSPSTSSPTEKGCISLASDYADDLYGILSQGSSVTIRR